MRSAIARRCGDRLAELRRQGLRIPQPFDATELVARVNRVQGRRITLVAVNMPAGTPYGLTLFTETGEHIIAYEITTNRVHRDHIIVHELAHVVMGHQPIDIAGADATRSVLPNLAPTLVARVLGRTGGYTDVEEREAETMATLLLQRAGRPDDRVDFAGLPADEAAVCRRLHESFENPC